MMQVFINGLSTGFVLQLAIGPVFFFILNITLQRTMVDGLFSVVAVTVVDYCYILLALVGVGKMLEYQKIKKTLSITSACALCIFGIFMLLSTRSTLTHSTIFVQSISNYWSSFLSAFLLTISSPLTIVFWTSLFASKAIEYGYSKRQLVIFGLSAGLSTLLFLGSAVMLLSLSKTVIPLFLVKILNVVVGFVLMIYGTIRLVSVLSVLRQFRRSGRAKKETRMT